MDYVKCRGKIRVDNKKYSYSDLTEWVKNKGQVGWLIPKGFIVIDVDDPKDAQKVFDVVIAENVKCGINKTLKGYHFIFKDDLVNRKQQVRALSALGIVIDTRTPGNNYIILPVNDSNRMTIRETPKDDCPIPKWLSPLAQKTGTIDFKTGSRNDTLQRHAWRLVANGFTNEETIDTLIKINKYILDEPLSDTELATTVAREDNLELAKTKTDEKFKHNIFADQLMQKFKFKTFYDQVHCYMDGVYIPYDIDLLMVQVMPSIKISQKKEVKEYIKTLTKAEPKSYKKAFLQNGVYDLDNGLMCHSDEYISASQCHFSYDENAYDENIDKFLDDISCKNKVRRQLILEMVGLSLFDSILEQKLFILTGPKAANGKSTFLSLITLLIGEENASHEDLKNLANEKYSLPELTGKLVNISAEISSSFIDDLSVIKKVTGGDKITVDRKYGQPFSFINCATLLFSTNELPSIKMDNGMLRRLVLVNFEASFQDTGDFIFENLTHQRALDYLGTISLMAYTAMKERGQWSNIKESQKLLNNFVKENDSCEAFLQQPDEVFDLEITTSQLYNDYRIYCVEASLKPKTIHKFNAAVRKYFDINVATRNGKTCQIITKKEEK